MFTGASLRFFSMFKKCFRAPLMPHSMQERLTAALNKRQTPQNMMPRKNGQRKKVGALQTPYTLCILSIGR